MASVATQTSSKNPCRAYADDRETGSRAEKGLASEEPAKLRRDERARSRYASAPKPTGDVERRQPNWKGRGARGAGSSSEAPRPNQPPSTRKRRRRSHARRQCRRRSRERRRCSRKSDRRNGAATRTRRRRAGRSLPRSIAAATSARCRPCLAAESRVAKDQSYRMPRAVSRIDAGRRQMSRAADETGVRRRGRAMRPRRGRGIRRSPGGRGHGAFRRSARRALPARDGGDEPGSRLTTQRPVAAPGEHPQLEAEQGDPEREGESDCPSWRRRQPCRPIRRPRRGRA